MARNASLTKLRRACCNPWSLTSLEKMFWSKPEFQIADNKLGNAANKPAMASLASETIWSLRFWSVVMVFQMSPRIPRLMNAEMTPEMARPRSLVANWISSAVNSRLWVVASSKTAFKFCKALINWSWLKATGAALACAAGIAEPLATAAVAKARRVAWENFIADC